MTDKLSFSKGLGVAVGVTAGVSFVILTQSLVLWLIAVYLVKLNVGYWQIVGCSLIWSILQVNLFPDKK